MFDECGQLLYSSYTNLFLHTRIAIRSHASWEMVREWSHVVRNAHSGPTSRRQECSTDADGLVPEGDADDGKDDLRAARYWPSSRPAWIQPVAQAALCCQRSPEYWSNCPKRLLPEATPLGQRRCCAVTDHAKCAIVRPGPAPDPAISPG